MQIGIIGAGNIGGTLARLWADAGHPVMVSSRHPETLRDLVRNIGSNAYSGPVEEAIAFGKVLLLAIPLKGLSEIVPAIEEHFDGEVVMDAMNPFPGRDGEIANTILNRGIASGVATQEQLKRRKVVRAFSSVYYSDLQTESGREEHPVAIPIAGNDPEAKQVAADLIRDAGFVPHDLGSLADSKPLDPGGILFGKTYTLEQIRSALGD